LRHLRSEISGEINGSSNFLKCLHGDFLEGGVIGNLESSSNSGDGRERDVLEIVVSNKCETTLAGSEVSNTGQVRCRVFLEKVVDKDQGSVDRCQRWSGNSLDIPEGHVVGPDEVRETDNQTIAVTSNVETLADVGNLCFEFDEARVVVNIQQGDFLQVDTVETLDECVGNYNTISGRNGLWEGQGSQQWEPGPVNALYTGENIESQCRQRSNIVQVELAGNRRKSGALDVVCLGVISNDKITEDPGWTRDIDLSTGSRTNCHRLQIWAVGILDEIGVGIDGN